MVLCMMERNLVEILGLSQEEGTLAVDNGDTPTIIYECLLAEDTIPDQTTYLRMLDCGIKYGSSMEESYVEANWLCCY